MRMTKETRSRLEVILNEIIAKLGARFPKFKKLTRAEKIALIIDGWYSADSVVLCEFEEYGELYPDDDAIFDVIHTWIDIVLRNELVKEVLPRTFMSWYD
jgi:hypothetical protein